MKSPSIMSGERDERVRTYLDCKIGSSLITQHGRGINGELIDHWASGFARLKARGVHVILVSRGLLPKA